ncbi:lytic transglycosylase domain-containing protein [Acuticoccus sp. I52.16.1]|uniref:lytic transglycosylase domain-containing protein n=1 Tax=Acuticoccus sp. I52.16.1 TaxID=2928472 RepID=UPI001FCFD919|nr:lytic transglycosylase domain-containing protein [Acuticoccus sp. I52.16.1]UOM34007.1 lytic transglycosylase domain-containing protein [Acuticoccus sp. I52.16.1]
MRFCVVNSVTILTLAASVGAVSAAPLSSLPRAPVAAGVLMVDERVPVPQPHPRAAARAGTGTSTSTSAALPSARIIGRVENGQAVPVAAAAFAARADRGPMKTLFEAAEKQADPNAPVASIAAVAARSSSPALLAGHGAPRAGGPSPFAAEGRQASSLKGALDALKADRYQEALQRRNGLSDPLDQKIVDYFLVRAGTNELSSAMIADYAVRAPDWPEPELVRGRAEEALSRENPGADAVIKAMGGQATSLVGKRLLANAMIAEGDVAGGMKLVRSVWHERALGTGLQSAYVDDFAARLTIDDHLERIDKLIANNRFEEAQALRGRLGTGPRAYLDARIAVATNNGRGGRALASVPADLRKRPGYRLAQIEEKRREDDLDAAARLIETASKRDIVDGDAWWVETRIVARMMAEKGDGKRAYQLVTIGFAEGAVERADQAFHAGWFAMRYLRDGNRAARHFAELEQIATTPLSLSRAHYWRGRAAALAGHGGEARTAYNEAAHFGFTYYGQLARAEIGASGTGVGRAPDPTPSDRAMFARNEVAEAVSRLIKSGHKHRIATLLAHLAKTVPTPGQAALAAQLADEAGYPHLALMVAKDAQRRGLDVGRLAYPSNAIPHTAKVPTGLDRAVVFSIARQESEFNPGAVSPVGASGLMQVMPQTAAAMARELGLSHSQSKLTSDPGYNATLGAAYLAKRLGNYNGSYILTFAAYNAGAGRVNEWIQRFGDPRDPNVDALAWVEDIPYPETRNYVQRVMENVQVYREALGTGRLAIETDLSRGRQS